MCRPFKYAVRKRKLPASIAGMCLLESGNILFTNWGGHGGSTGGAILEVTRDKKLVFSTGNAVKNRASSIFVID